MSSNGRLKLASFAFAMMWVAGMIWWQSPMTTAKMVILAMAGALAGTVWYCGMRWWMDSTMRQ
jgi:hypothetical protein